jgi:hypothetical protein
LVRSQSNIGAFEFEHWPIEEAALLDPTSSVRRDERRGGDIPGHFA